MEAPERVEAFRLRVEETFEGVRVGAVPEAAVDVVDNEGVRRVFVVGLGYCCDAGEVDLGGWGTLR